MTVIEQEDLIQTIADSLQYISYYHPLDYIQALGRAYELEQSPAAKDAIAQILTNSRMSAEGKRPICQDTGIVTVFVKVGIDVRWGGATMGVTDMINEGVRRGYLNPDNVLRASIVSPPEGARKNTKDNTPAVIHYEIVPGDKVDVQVAAKGGGSENKSKFAMLNPSDSIVDWILKTVPTMGAGWCPPGMLGIGIGGTAEKAMLMAKESLMAPIDIQEIIARGPQDWIEELRVELHEKVNALGIGAQGLGGLATVLDVKILAAPTHAASKPVAFHARRQRCREARSAAARRMAEGSVDTEYQNQPARRPEHADAGRSRKLEARPDTAAVGQDAHRSRRRAQAHRRYAGEGRKAAGRLHEPRDLLRRPGRSGARRSSRPRRPDHRDAHGQVH
jgi:tartrate/fumarate subfamily iron-sulfur-dependent hydro-lyase alpha chain